jgi:hypothetical protein
MFKVPPVSVSAPPVPMQSFFEIWVSCLVHVKKLVFLCLQIFFQIPVLSTFSDVCKVLGNATAQSIWEFLQLQFLRGGHGQLKCRQMLTACRTASPLGWKKGKGNPQRLLWLAKRSSHIEETTRPTYTFVRLSNRTHNQNA